MSREQVRENEDGLVHSFVVALIITLIAFLIILGFAIRTGVIANEDADVNICRVTLAAQELSQMRLSMTNVRLDSPLASACKRRIVEISERGVYLIKRGPNTKIPVYLNNSAGNLQRTTNYDLQSERSAAYRQQVLASHFSESMRRCWLRGLEGQVEVFNDRTLFSSATVCMLCDETRVQLSSSPPRGAWLSSYIHRTTMPTDSEKRTYGEYLFTMTSGDSRAYGNWMEGFADGATLGAIRLLGLDPSADRFTTNAQSVCIIENNINQNPSLRDGTYATVFFRDFSKFQTGCMAVAVVPAQQVRTLCDYVAN